MVWAGVTLAAGVLVFYGGGLLGSENARRYWKKQPDATTEEVTENIHPLMILSVGLLILGGVAIAVGGLLWLVVEAVLWLA